VTCDIGETWILNIQIVAVGASSNQIGAFFHSIEVTMALATTAGAEGAKQWMKQNTEGDKVKNDRELVSDGMVTGLCAAPVCVQIMGKLCQIAAMNRDFPLDDTGVEIGKDKQGYPLIKTPGSMRATLCQVTQDAYWAFVEADTAMYSISLATPRVKTVLSQGLQCLFMGSDEEVKAYWPITLQEIENIANDCTVQSANVVEKFNHVVHVIQEIQRVGLQKRLATETDLAKKEALKEEAEKTQQLLEERAKKLEADQKRFEEEEKEKKKALADAVESLPSAGDLAGLAIVDGISKMLSSFDLTTAATAAINPAAGAASKASTVMEGMAAAGAQQAAQGATGVAQQGINQGMDALNTANDSVVLMLQRLQGANWISGMFDKSKNTLNKAKLVAAGDNKLSVNKASTLLDSLKLDFQVKVDPNANPAAKAAANDALDKLEKAVQFAERQDLAGQYEADSGTVIQDLESSMNNVSSILSNANNIVANQTIDKPTPMDSRIEQQGGGGSCAAAVEMATVKLHSAQASLDKAKERVDKQYERMLQNDNKLHEEMMRVERLSKEAHSLGEIIQVLYAGLQALTELSERWTQLTTFFREIATYIKVSMSKEMMAFVEFGGKAKDLRHLEYTRNMMYKLAFKASSTASVAGAQATLYRDISQKHLMPLAIQANAMSGIRKEDADVKYRELENSCNAALASVKSFVQAERTRHLNSIDQRQSELENSFKALVPEAEAEQFKPKAKMIVDLSKTKSASTATNMDFSDFA